MSDTTNQAETTTGAPRITFMAAVTEAYEGDPKALIDKLNLLRAEELVTELIYRHQAYIAVSLAMPGVKAEFEEHAVQEAKHADMLAERISQLGGSPVFDPTEIAKGADALRIEFGEPKTLEEMIAFDLHIERRQIVQYTRLIREVAFHDPTTRRVLEDILIDTEHHAADMADLLSKTS
jgi:bacterioferritin